MSLVSAGDPHGIKIQLLDLISLRFEVCCQTRLFRSDCLFLPMSLIDELEKGQGRRQLSTHEEQEEEEISCGGGKGVRAPRCD